MSELEEALTGESAHAAPAHILEELGDSDVNRKIAGAPHTIYEEDRKSTRLNSSHS